MHDVAVDAYPIVHGAVILQLVAAPGPLQKQGPEPYGIYPPRDLQNRRPLTRAERSGFLETSRYADVMAFIDSLKATSRNIYVTTMGRTSQGRDIPIVVISRPIVRTPADAKRLNRPIVYVQGNIHGGEVEGKEALLSLLRDLDHDQYQNVIDSLVIVAAPIYNHPRRPARPDRGAAARVSGSKTKGTGPLN